MSPGHFSSLLSRIGALSSREMFGILDAAEAAFRESPKLVRITSNPQLSICGDIHGQYEDLRKLFRINGAPSKSNRYLFNGDFVDRGKNSVGCVLTLFLHKLIEPDSMYLNRGNHEMIEMNSYYGFKQEVGNAELFQRFNEVFELLPTAHIINEEIFVVHGGLPKKPDLVEKMVADDAYKNELLWNDPCDENGVHPNPRGRGVYRFGPDVTETFLRLNKLKTLVRSHEVVQGGYEVTQNGRCITVFSAANYTGYYRNKGGFLIVDSEGNITPHSFSSDVGTSRL
jgi:serine/threonine-protein phosphatase 5